MKTLLVFPILAFAFLAPVAAQTSEDPVPVRTVPPVYPQELKRDGVAGLVVVRCTIDERGNVVDPEVVKASHTAFEVPAVEAVRKWKFKPAQLDGNIVAKRVTIPIKFVFE